MFTQISEDMKRYNYLVSEIDSAYHEAALKSGLSDSSMLILYAVCNNGDECLISDIKFLTGVSKQTLNSALRKLENDGFIRLEKVDAKKKKVCLTGEGRLLADRTAMKIIDIENSIFGSWTEDERNSYIRLTQKFLTMFKEKIREL